ncbi:gluconate kinase [Weizmannia acidilactici]|uniref:Gluconate kinase n=1 Tax=Weizmannia acidilactici TaxID=2607726 RepID=A0A5J4JK72_9BACI|nr:gluconokinase [Weizmannia acidilactici]GER66490.1 gluconate kinase [Weizmannia acidilactici]GER69364.1 gluconate kinase [Weizmannia acidilactici]GER72309.1 gluconate kinase [Weizmannia acidilactici]
MTASSYYLGVDIGTTTTKSVLFGAQGKVISMHHVGYPLHSPSPDVAEQDPDEIFRAVKETMKTAIAKGGINPSDIELVSFSSAMHSLIAVDADGKPLTRCITWADARSTKWAKKIKNEWNGIDIYRRTGTPIHPMSPLAKITWLKNDKPDLFEKTYKFIGIKEYIFYRFFGQYVVDYSIASATGLFHLESLDWDRGALKVAGISADQLSKPVSTTFFLTGLDPIYAHEIGIPQDTPFVIGASDGVLSNLGVNAIDPGVVAITIGTSGAIRTVTDKPATDPKGRIFCYALTENHWVVGGPVNNGGMTFRWVRDELASAEVETAKRLGLDPYEVLTKIASRVAPGSDGLIFHPYLAGERAPIWNANARGSFFGLGLHHKREHMVRAVLEGVIYNLYTVMLALQEMIGVPQKIQATGGFARSELWRQMLADIFNQEVVVPESFESSCLGAIVLGMYALGKIDDFSIVSEWVGSTHTHRPIPENVTIYEEILPIYIRVSRLLEAEYGNIAAFQRKWVKG